MTAGGNTPGRRRDIAALPGALRDGLAAPHLPGLDGLRMVAVFLVVFYHFGFEGSPGGHGVLAFFVLSGFLITWLLLKEEEQFGAVSLKLFYFRRALRIFPAFYCYWLLLTAYLLVSGKTIVWGQAASSFAYVGNYYQAIFGDPDTGYSHTWSLGIEEQFYLLWPACLIALGLRPRRIMALALFIGAVWVYRAALELGIGVNQGYIYEAFDTRADHLAMGCLLALLLRGGYFPRLWERLCTPAMSLLTIGLLVVSVLLARSLGTGYRNVAGFAVDPILIAALIAQVIALSASPLWRWLNWRWVAYLGALSYSIYLWQQLVVGRVGAVFSAYPLPAQMAATVAAVVAVAAASHHLIERPFLRLKKRAAPGLSGARAAAPGPMGAEEHFEAGENFSPRRSALDRGA